jgi:hemerythrin-like domain-containing protein
MSRHHESLIPLSREHHYGLMVCLRIHRGLVSHRHDAQWLEQQSRKVVRFFESDLLNHFSAEETLVFAAMSGIAEASKPIARLVEEHRRLEEMVRELRQTKGLSLAPLLLDFADLLEAHIRQEERELFTLYERFIPESTAAEVGLKVLERIGTAAKPKDPALLE